jgi:hypothetical protein
MLRFIILLASLGKCLAKRPPVSRHKIVYISRYQDFVRFSILLASLGKYLTKDNQFPVTKYFTYPVIKILVDLRKSVKYCQLKLVRTWTKSLAQSEAYLSQISSGKAVLCLGNLNYV